VQKAVELLEHVIAVEARTLQDDHPLRLVSVEALADMYAELVVDSDEASSSSLLQSLTIAGLVKFVMQLCIALLLM
jgi:hypothetical protein